MGYAIKLGNTVKYSERQGCFHIGNYYGSGVAILWWVDYNGTMVLHHGSYETWQTIFDGDISVKNSYGNYGSSTGNWYYGVFKNTSGNPYYMQIDAEMIWYPGQNVSFTVGKYGKKYMQLQKNVQYAIAASQSTGGGASFSIHPGMYPTA